MTPLQASTSIASLFEGDTTQLTMDSVASKLSKLKLEEVGQAPKLSREEKRQFNGAVRQAKAAEKDNNITVSQSCCCVRTQPSPLADTA